MIKNKHETKINFKPVTLSDKELYESYLFREEERGCEFSFANLYLWGEQNFSHLSGGIALLSRFGQRVVYPYPLGCENLREALDAIIADSEARGIPCHITGLSASAREVLEELYPDKFRFYADEGSFDYVYSIDDLADLTGKKYQAKRNHLNRFRDAFPNYTVEPIDENNVDAVKKLADEWYDERLSEDPSADYRMERSALEGALRDYRKLGMVGLALMSEGEVLAFTFASRMANDTFDVHFEKARSQIQGAYAAINRELARYIREKYPSVKYLDREEDMGLPGLRKSKLSYHPCRMVKKYRAYLRTE